LRNWRGRISALFVCALALFLSGNVLHWPIWLLLLLSVFSVGSAVALMAGRRRHHWFPQPPPDPSAFVPEGPPMEPVLQELRLQDATLPSVLADYEFFLSATVHWYVSPYTPTMLHAYPSGLAVAAILGRAQEVSRQEHPSHGDGARYRISSALGTPELDATGRVVAYATDVTLHLAEEDRDRLRELAQYRKAEQVWEHQRRYERNRRAYIGDEVLRTPGSAVVWWLALHVEEVERATTMISPLVLLSAAANDMDVPEPYRQFLKQSEPTPDVQLSADEPPSAHVPHPVVPDDALISRIHGVMGDLGIVEGSDEWTVLLHRIARSAEAADRTEAAQRIRQDLGEERSGRSLFLVDDQAEGSDSVSEFAEDTMATPPTA
jgi:hypothetical protein